MSRHVISAPNDNREFVFGWDQPLMSFYLQVHDTTRDADDEENPRIVAWLGADRETTMYEVEDLSRAARKHGLIIPYAYKVILVGDKDDGK